MTRDAAVVAVVIALMVGYYWARWRRAETTNRVAKAAVDTAGKTVWRARGAMLLVGIAVYVVIDLWFHGKGRLRGPRGTAKTRRRRLLWRRSAIPIWVHGH